MESLRKKLSKAQTHLIHIDKDITDEVYKSILEDVEKLRARFTKKQINVTAKIYYMQITFEIIFKLPDEHKEEFIKLLGKQ
jgi:uncharacterized membrane protein YcaP (DUF421 family)